jgi:hypothetical protein
MKTFETVTTQKITALVCDGCGLQVNAGDYAFHEFISVNQRCGYGSIHGDGKQINTDLCQQCFSDMCGDALRVTEETDSCIDNNSDLNVVVKNILSKNNIANKNELTLALQRVEKLWDAQHLSAEGNELHQLADIICAHEKKDWDSFFEQPPLANEDFMPDRSSFKSKITFDEEKTASGMLSSIYINTNIDDESSRDSVLAHRNLDDAKKNLLESITNVQVKYPELRLGQLLINVLNIQKPCPEIFHIEDNILAEKLSQLSL